MRPGTMRAAAIGGVATVGLAATALLGHAFVGTFLSPVPLTSAKGIVPPPPVLPSEVVLPGAESRELAKLLAGPEPPTPKSPREALFPVAQAMPKPQERVTRLRRPEVMTRDDARVDAAVRFLSEDGHARGALMAMFQRAGRYRPSLERILHAWKVPEDVMALIFVENGFLPGLVQADGCAGLWTLSPEVAKAYGLTTRETYDERRGVEASSEASGRYLADLRERFGSWALAIYAYGRGYKRTVADLAKERSVKFEEIADDLPAPDRTYVFNAFAVATILANPERFGLDSVRPDPPLATSDMEVPGQAPFSIIAQAAGTSVSRLRDLNPEYLSDTVPATGNAMIVHLPREGLARAKELLTPLLYAPSHLSGQVGVITDDAPDAGPRKKGRKGGHHDDGAGTVAGSPSYYRVHDGDTLDSVAHRFGVAREAIASDNALDPTASLVTGQILRLRTEDGKPPGGK